MDINKIKENLLYGERYAIKAVEYIMNYGMVTVSKTDNSYIKFIVNDTQDEVHVEYDSYLLILNIIEKIKKEGHKVYKLESPFSEELQIIKCSCREDLLKRKVKENIKDAQILFMNIMQYKLVDPANVSEQEISEFKDYLKEKSIKVFKSFQSLGEQYKISSY